jgi:biopolymer transport protein ExbD
MRAPSNSTRGGYSFNLTPMIDVVFQLLIFFLVSSRLAQQEVQLEMDLPQAKTGQGTSEEDQVRRVVVNVLPEDRPQGQLMVGGRLMQGDEVAQLIQYESRQHQRHIEVRIRSDRKVPYRTVEPVMIACARAGVWKVTFAVVGD